MEKNKDLGKRFEENGIVSSGSLDEPNEVGSEDVNEEPSFIVKSDSDSIKKLISMLSTTNQPMMSINRSLNTMDVLGKVLWGIALVGISLVVYQNIIYTPESISVVRPIDISSMLLITVGIVVTSSLIGSYLNTGLLDSFYPDNKLKSFKHSITIAPVGIVLWATGIYLAGKNLSNVGEDQVFVQTGEVSDGLAQVTADQVLSLLPLVIYVIGLLISIVYLVGAVIAVRTIRANARKTGNFAKVMEAKYIKITSQE